MMKGVLRFWLAGLGGVLFATAACGPSFQAIYEGNARFEHCYALEENPQTSMREKAACWRDWSEHYTYGQTRDRIHYATARYVALSQAPQIPTDEALMMAAPGEAPRLSTITAPAPTNAFAPPPKVMEPPPRPPEADAGVAIEAGAAAASVLALALPASSCADRCGDEFRDCSGGCVESDAGKARDKKARSCQQCQKTYRACMRGCFK